MRWLQLLGGRGEPARCNACGAMLGELVDGVLIQRHGDRESVGAYAVRCRRKAGGERCAGSWLSPLAAARAAAVAAHDAADQFEAARIAYLAAQATATAAKRLFDAAADVETP